jgi:hypothetical protein
MAPVSVPVHKQNAGIREAAEVVVNDGIDSDEEFIPSIIPLRSIVPRAQENPSSTSMVTALYVDDGQRPGWSSRLPQQRRTIAELSVMYRNPATRQMAYAEMEVMVPEPNEPEEAATEEVPVVWKWLELVALQKMVNEANLKISAQKQDISQQAEKLSAEKQQLENETTKIGRLNGELNAKNSKIVELKEAISGLKACMHAWKFWQRTLF